MPSGLLLVNDKIRSQSTPTTPSDESQAASNFTAVRCPVHPIGSMLNPLSFRELAKGSDEIWIEGGGQLYRLRQTKQNKLILTK